MPWRMSRTVAAPIRQAFDQSDRAHAGETWRKVAETGRPHGRQRTRRAGLIGLPVLASNSPPDSLAPAADRRGLPPRRHCAKLYSANPIERLNEAVKRRADVVGIFSNDAAIMRQIGAVLFKRNDAWQTATWC